MHRHQNETVPLLSDRQSFWPLLAVLCGVISAMKGFRLPGYWPATQAQLDYSHGFVKRGFFGATLTRLLHLNLYSHFALVSTVLLFSLLGVLFLYAQKSGLRSYLRSVLPIAAFAASYTLTYLCHLNGYADILLGLLTIGLLFIRDPRPRFLLAIPVTLVALLIHEFFLFVFFPLLLLSFVLQIWSERDVARRHRIVVAVSLLALIAVAATIRIAWGTSLHPRTISLARLSAETQARVNFPIDLASFEILYRSAADNFHILLQFAHHRFWWAQQAAGILLYLPLECFMLTLLFRLISGAQVQGRRGLLTVCTAVALSPLLMNVFGWDVGRWYTLTSLVTFLVLCTVCRFLKVAPVLLSPALEHGAILLLVLGMASGGMLMGGQPISPYPFIMAGFGQGLHPPSVPARK